MHAYPTIIHVLYTGRGRSSLEQFQRTYWYKVCCVLVTLVCSEFPKCVPDTVNHA